MPEKSAPLRVLIVDDEPLIRWSLAETLRSSGCVVAEAGDARDTIRLLQDQVAPDVVVLDYRLPDSHDFALLATVRRIAPGSQVILMTAYGTPEVRHGALELGVRHVVTKPFEAADMVVLIRQAHESGRS